MKKLLIGLMILALPLTAFSASTSYTCQGVSYPIMVNGSQMTITGTPVMNYKGTTLLPLRAVAEALNIPIIWDNVNKQVKIDTIDTAKLAESCVEIYISKNGQDVSRGSGVIIDYDEILTCYHMTDSGDSYRAIYNDNAVAKATLTDYDTDVDSSVLTPSEKDIKPVKIGDSDDVKVGDKVYVISSPKGVKNVVTEGKVLKYGIFKGVNVFVVSAKSDHGSSGGACFNSKGELVGILKGGSDDMLNGYIIPINNIRKELAN